MLKCKVLVAESSKHPDGHPKALKLPVAIPGAIPCVVLVCAMFNAVAAALHSAAVVMGKWQMLLVAVEYVSVMALLLVGDGVGTETPGIERRWRNACICSNVTLSDVVGRLPE